MGNNKLFTGWVHVWPNGDVQQKFFYARWELIQFWSLHGGMSWKQLYRKGHRAVKVEVKIIER